MWGQISARAYDLGPICRDGNVTWAGGVIYVP